MLRPILLCWSLAVSANVLAHGVVHEQIESLDHAIRHHPDHAELYLRRGRLLLEEAHDDEARRDFQMALRLDAGQRSAHYFLGSLALKEGNLDSALQETLAFITSLSGEPGALLRAHRQLGEIYSARQDFPLAVTHFEQVVAVADPLLPEHVLELASACLQLPDVPLEKAVRALDHGMERLGPLPVLQDRAVEIEVLAGRSGSALQRIDAMIQSGQRLPDLCARKGHLLMQLGQRDQAERSFREALQHLDTLPPSRRATPAAQALRDSIDQQLEKLVSLRHQ